MQKNPVSKSDFPKREFEEIADEFITQIRNCEDPGIEDYQNAYPQFASQIQEQFPGLQLAEKLATQRVSNTTLQLDLPFKLGQYELLEELGRGGMGVVYRASHLELETEFAVKVIAEDTPDATKRVQRFKREAQAISTLHHRCIVPLIDFGSSGRLFYIVMRKIDGITLGQLIDEWNSDGPSESDAIRAPRNNWRLLASLFAEIADGLHCVHANDLIHRDIKPSNLLIGKDSRVWISDFGLAKCTQSDTDRITTSGTPGTPRYLAPESIRGTHDSRSDIYSLGVTMFEVFSGLKAFGSECGAFPSSDGLSLPNLRLINETIPRSLAKIVSKACDPRPSERFRTAQEMSQQLRKFALTKHGTVFHRIFSALFSK